MNINIENYLKEIQSIATKHLLESRVRGELLDKQNQIMQKNNELLEDLLFEIKQLNEKM